MGYHPLTSHLVMIPPIDFETYSESGHVWDEARGKWGPPGKRGLPVVGLANYARHPSTEVLCMAYGLGSWQVWRPGMPPPADLFAHIAAGGLVEAWNSGFEWHIWNLVCVARHGWPPLPQGQLRCAMAKSRAYCLPGSLALAGEVLGIEHGKDRDGTRLLNKFSVPRNPTKGDPRRRLRPEDDPVDGPRLYDYCLRDVVAELEASVRMPDLSPLELAYWQSDQRINQRGVQIDAEGVRACADIVGQCVERYDTQLQALAGCKTSELQRLTGWLGAQGVHTDSLDTDAVEALLAQPQLPDPARQALELRQRAGSASVKKVYAMQAQMTDEGRLHNLYSYHGARTGRPTGSGPQPTNLPRAGPDVYRCTCGKHYGPHRVTCPWCGAVRAPGKPAEWSPEAVEDALEAIGWRSLDMLEHVYGDALLTVAGCLRGLFVAAPGMELVSSDFTAIEGVVIACLAGEQWRIDAFAADAPMYLLSAERMFGVPVTEMLAYAKEHGKHHHLRQPGKAAELACLAPETEVLTDHGYVAIVDVTLDHRVWDGETWVNHAGVVRRGRKQVVALDGVRMTPKHKVLCGTSWREAKSLVLNPDILCRSLGTATGKLPSSVLGLQGSRTAKSGYAVPAVARITRLRSVRCGQGPRPAAGPAQSKKPGKLDQSYAGLQPPVLTTGIGAVFSGAYRWRYPAATIPRIASGKTTAVGESRYIPSGLRIERNFSPTSRACRVGTTPGSKWTASIMTRDTPRATYGSPRGRRTWRIDAVSGLCRGELPNLSDVYDIAHAGPRNRFVIRTNSGHLIVHNCGFGGWIGALQQFGAQGSEDDLKDMVLKWRKASPAIEWFWGGQTRGGANGVRVNAGLLPWADRWDRTPEYYGLEGAAVQALMLPGITQPVLRLDGTPSGVSYSYSPLEDVLLCTVPSGGHITYHCPRLVPAAMDWRGQSIQFEGYNTNPKNGATGWVSMRTYGGRLAENCVQRVARDIQMHAIEQCERAGHPVVLHTYDEIVCEGRGLTVERLESLMTDVPDWAGGWPIKAAGGWCGRRYRKA